MRLVDRRWAGIAKGVGTQKILGQAWVRQQAGILRSFEKLHILSSPGRVHMAQIQIEKDYLTSSFSILEEQPMDMLLGLDMLKKHQCTIDLKRNVLVIGTTGTETPFLAEADLPPCARLSSQANEEDAVRSSAKEAKEAEDRQLAEAIAR